MEISLDQVSQQMNEEVLFCKFVSMNPVYSTASNTVRDALLGLVNFLAFFEAEEGNKEEIEAEVQNLKHLTMQNEKRLVEEERYLDKCRQVEIYEPSFIISIS